MTSKRTDVFSSKLIKSKLFLLVLINKMAEASKQQSEDHTKADVPKPPTR